jgi:hypothetical protein
MTALVMVFAPMELVTVIPSGRESLANLLHARMIATPTVCVSEEFANACMAGQGNCATSH